MTRDVAKRIKALEQREALTVNEIDTQVLLNAQSQFRQAAGPCGYAEYRYKVAMLDKDDPDTPRRSEELTAAMIRDALAYCEQHGLAAAAGMLREAQQSKLESNIQVISLKSDTD
jgi:hypothetical protein